MTIWDYPFSYYRKTYLNYNVIQKHNACKTLITKGIAKKIVRITNEDMSGNDCSDFFFLAIIALQYLSIVHGNVFTVDLATVTTQRLDPIVFENESPEGHVHSIVGASKFSKTSTYEELLSSQCSTGNVDKDLSAYWAPSLYVKKSSGKFQHVDMNFAVYYKLINDNGQTDFHVNPIVPGEFKSFPPGFKMLAGSQ